MTIRNHYKISEISQTGSKMTLILGARCTDGVVLVADTKFTIDEGSDYIHDREKITGGIIGVLSAFSGSRPISECFRVELRHFISNNTGCSTDRIIMQISEIMNNLDKKFGSNWDSFDVMLGMSGTKFPHKESVLRYFYRDGRHEPVKQYKAVGSGSPHATYFLKRYYREGMTMKEFAQLSDFIIRYISHEEYPLDMSVGLDPKCSYPQIIYIPDDPNYCKPFNDGNPKVDCSPSQIQLDIFKEYSEKKIKEVHSLTFGDVDGS